MTSRAKIEVNTKSKYFNTCVEREREREKERQTGRERKRSHYNKIALSGERMSKTSRQVKDSWFHKLQNLIMVLFNGHGPTQVVAFDHHIVLVAILDSVSKTKPCESTTISRGWG